MALAGFEGDYEATPAPPPAALQRAPRDPHGPAQPHDRDPAGRDELVEGGARHAPERGRPRDGQQKGALGRGG